MQSAKDYRERIVIDPKVHFGKPCVAGTLLLTQSRSGWRRWLGARYAIEDFPFTGCGLKAFRRVVPVVYPLFTVPPGTDIGHAHNIFLQTALDLGIPGLVAYLALLVEIWGIIKLRG